MHLPLIQAVALQAMTFQPLEGEMDLNHAALEGALAGCRPVDAILVQGCCHVLKKQRRIYYSAAQRADIWDRWKVGEPMSSNGRRFDRESSVLSMLSPTGGIRPADRTRASQTLSLGERDEMSPEL